jgi:hypothetical protein
MVTAFAETVPFPTWDRLRFTVIIEKVAVTDAAWFMVSVQVDWVPEQVPPLQPEKT